jgi:hypothetical protein
MPRLPRNPWWRENVPQIRENPTAALTNSRKPSFRHYPIAGNSVAASKGFSDTRPTLLLLDGVMLEMHLYVALSAAQRSVWHYGVRAQEASYPGSELGGERVTPRKEWRYVAATLSQTELDDQSGS